MIDCLIGSRRKVEVRIKDGTVHQAVDFQAFANLRLQYIHWLGYQLSASVSRDWTYLRTNPSLAWPPTHLTAANRPEQSTVPYISHKKCNNVYS